MQLAVNAIAQTISFTVPSPVTYGSAPITLSATGGASGNPITFSILSGPGSITGSTLTINGAGSVVVAANQAGNATYAAAAQVTQSIVVNPASAAIAVASSASTVLAQNAVTLTATVSSPAGVPTGTVSFLDGTTPLGPGTLSGGVATLTTSSLAVGMHSISAVYSGGTNFAAATSAALTQCVMDISLGTTAGGSSQTATPGGSATVFVGHRTQQRHVVPSGSNVDRERSSRFSDGKRNPGGVGFLIERPLDMDSAREHPAD